MRSVVGRSEDDWAGLAEVEQAEELAAAATATEVKVDKVPILGLLLSLAHAHAHGRTSRRLLQTADHPERGQ
jgi:hypothetical protein